jgi:hypothetical protein
MQAGATKQPSEGRTMNTRTLIAAAVLALGSATVFAQAASAPAATPRVDQRQANQEKRIDQGIASGALNKRETVRLEKEQAHINRAENRAKADGTVTKAERARLHKMQNHASKDIHHQKHDGQVAKP